MKSAPRRIYMDLSIVRTPQLGNGEVIKEEFRQLVLVDSNDKNNHVDIVVGREFSGQHASRYHAKQGVISDSKDILIEGATIYNFTAQVGKELYAEIHYDTTRTDNSLSLDAAFELITPISGADDLSGISIGGVTQTLIAADSTRKNLGILNRLAQDVWIKFSNNNNVAGRLLPSGAYMETQNRANIYVLGLNTEAAVPITGVGIHTTPEY